MRNMRKLVCAMMVLSSVSGLLCAQGASEETAYPSKEVNVIVIANAGGGTDAIARAVTTPLEKKMGKPFVVVNNGTAGGLVATEDIARAESDGYTLGVFSNTDVANFAWSQKNSEVKVEDYTYIAALNTTSDIVVLKKGSQFKNLEEVIAYAKKNPGKLTMGLPSPTQKMSLALFENTTGTDVTDVVYGGGNKVFADLLGGHVELGILGAKFVKQAKEQGMTILGIMLDDRLPSFADVPTFKEQGYEMLNPACRMLVGPKGISQDKVDALTKAIKEGYADGGEMKANIENLGEAAVLTTGAELAAFLKSDFEMRQNYYQNAQ